MKILVSAVIALTALIISCGESPTAPKTSNDTNTSTNTSVTDTPAYVDIGVDTAAVTEVADSIANPQSGAISEITDNILDDAVDLSGVTLSMTAQPQYTATITYTSGSLSNFMWDSNANLYFRINNPGAAIMLSNSFGNAGVIHSLEVTRQYFSNSDFTSPVQMTNPYRLSHTNNRFIKAFILNRKTTSDLTNIYTGNRRIVTVNFIATNTGLNDGTNGVIISGSRTFVATNINTVYGWTNVSSMLQTFSGLQVSRSNQSGTNYTAVYGSMSISMSNTFYNRITNRTLPALTTTVTFNRSRTVTVSDGTRTVYVDVVRGTTRTNQ